MPKKQWYQVLLTRKIKQQIFVRVFAESDIKALNEAYNRDIAGRYDKKWKKAPMTVITTDNGIGA